MKTQRAIFLPVVLFIITVPVYAQSLSTLDRLRNGVDLYAQGLFIEALNELHYVEAETISDAQRAEALYWIGITELSSGNYEAAVSSMDILQDFAPKNSRTLELPYHKGRALYYLGRYNESISLLGRYIDSLTVDINGAMDISTGFMKASALYWIGECLLSMGQMDKAEDVFQVIVNDFPNSYKYEASIYRIALIAQKKVEADLLELLKWTHEESLKTIDEYRRREHTYEQALIAYQKRIAEILKDTRLADLENENAMFRQYLASAEERIRGLENELRSAPAAPVSPAAAGTNTAPQPQSNSSNLSSRLSSMRVSALELMDELIKAEGDE